MIYLNWHSYKYYPYEQQLALREVDSLLKPKTINTTGFGITVNYPSDATKVDRLVYFSSTSPSDSLPPLPTQQALLERVNGNGVNRQSTRYSAHGLHEYKGKFNPQIAKALLNIFDIEKGAWALDPFCGSGTSLIEAAHLGINAIGVDINPLAIFLANAKVKALSISAVELLSVAKAAVKTASKSKRKITGSDPRINYLIAWFPEDVLSDIENLREAILSGPLETQEVLLVLASNLLREYSLQEPSDLRIRRRTSPMPDLPYLTAFEREANVAINKLADAQTILGVIKPNCRSVLLDCRKSLATLLGEVTSGFDVAITSPPYATALPYIDTQRLSLVWLGLIAPTDIMGLEATLLGSREIRGGKTELLDALLKNSDNLPEREANFCIQLQSNLTEQDGFRRQTGPRLLYRYFAGMAKSFNEVRAVMKPGAMYGLIVGGNHTVLGGRRFDIDTPSHLVSLAIACGWTHMETIGLQTFKRYGIHARNASTSEALIILKA